MVSLGNLESRIAMLPSDEAVKMTEVSIELHYIFLIGAVWWVEVWTQIYFEMSQILTVVSIEPEAKTDKLE